MNRRLSELPQSDTTLFLSASNKSGAAVINVAVAASVSRVSPGAPFSTVAISHGVPSPHRMLHRSRSVKVPLLAFHGPGVCLTSVITPPSFPAQRLSPHETSASHS